MNQENLQGQYAGVVTRFLAIFLDVIIISIVMIFVNWFVQSGSDQLLKLDITNCPTSGSIFRMVVCGSLYWFTRIFNVLFAPLYFLLLWLAAGQTIGKYVMGVRIVRGNGHRMTLGVCVRRLLGYLATIFTLGIGFFWLIIEDQRRALHDKVAGTVVIYAWQAREDERFLHRIKGWINKRYGKVEAEQ